MANETDKLAWHDLSPEMFPKNVQEALAKATEARKLAAEATDKVDTLLQNFAGRIQVPVMVWTRNSKGNMAWMVDESAGDKRVPLLSDGLEMVVSHRFGKLTVAAAPKTQKAKGKSNAVLA